jgi:hypothetical protein
MSMISFKTAVSTVVIAVATMSSVPATASVQYLYAVGASINPALDPAGNSIGGVPVISWTDTWSGGGTGILSILAEGIDLLQDDEVFVNGTSVGFLTQQSFTSSLFNLQPGAGALAGITDLTTTVFDVTSLLVVGVNQFQIKVDPGNWVNEIEMVSLTTAAAVPEPASWALVGLALAGLGLSAAIAKHDEAAAGLFRRAFAVVRGLSWPMTQAQPQGPLDVLVS